MSDEWHQTACILCSINCGIEVRLGGEDGRRFERVRGDKAHPASSGWIAGRGARALTSSKATRPAPASRAARRG